MKQKPEKLPKVVQRQNGGEERMRRRREKAHGTRQEQGGEEGLQNREKSEDKEAELQKIRQAQAGNGEAMAYLLERYKSLVRALTRPLFLMDGDQDDLVQEGMIGLFKAVQSYDASRGSSFETFANLCISRQLYSAVKASNRQKNIPLNSYISIYEADGAAGEAESERANVLGTAMADWQKNPEEIVIGKETAGVLEKLLFSRLSKMETQVLKYFLKGLTYKEIAARLGKSPKTIDNALQRIKAKVAKIYH